MKYSLYYKYNIFSSQMAVKNIMNEEQYKKLEKYIIKLQVISNKIEEATRLAKVA